MPSVPRAAIFRPMIPPAAHERLTSVATASSQLSEHAVPTNETDRSLSASLVVNGDRRTIRAGSTLAALLQSLSLDPQLIVVEHNRVILRDRASYDRVALADGDVLELVHFVGGG